MDRESAIRMLYGDEKNYKIIMASCSKILKLSKKDELLSGATNDALIKIKMYNDSFSTVKEHLVEKFPALFKDGDIHQFIAYLYMSAMMPPVVPFPKNKDQLDQITAFVLEWCKFVQRNNEGTASYFNDGEYGLVVDKPIRMDGQGGTTMFLNKLSYGGKKVKFVRRSSIFSKSVAGPIEVYDAFVDGEQINRIFINWYYGSAGAEPKAPVGYELSE